MDRLINKHRKINKLKMFGELKKIFTITFTFWIIPLFVNAQNLHGTKQIYSLNTLLDSALLNNYNLKSGLLNDSITLTEIESLAKNYQPQLSTSASFAYWNWLMPNKEKILGGNVNTDMYIQLTAYQLIYDWGLNKQKKQLQRADLSINKQFIRQLKQNVTWVLSQAYLDALKAKKTFEVNKNTNQQLKYQLAISENLYKIGKVSNVDVLKIKVSIAINEKEINTSKNEYDEKLTILKNLAFLKSNNQFDIEDKTKEWFAQLSGKEDFYSLDSISNNPTLKIMDEKITKQEQQNLLYQKQNKPQLFSYASTDWEHAYIPFGDNFNYNVGLGFRYTIPYWGGSSYKEKILISKIKQNQYSYQKNQIYWNIKKEIDALNISIKNKKEEINSNKHIVELTKQTYDNILLRYKNGQEIILDVLTAQTLLTKQTILYKKSLIEYLELLSKLNYLYGKDNYILY